MTVTMAVHSLTDHLRLLHFAAVWQLLSPPVTMLQVVIILQAKCGDEGRDGGQQN